MTRSQTSKPQSNREPPVKMEQNLGSETLFPTDSQNEANESPVKPEKNPQSKSFVITDSPSETDNVDNAFNFDPSQNLFSAESENICEIVPHVDNDILKEHILSIIIRRFGLETNQINTFLFVDINDSCENDNRMIPGVHEKLIIFIRDLRSVFYDKAWLTSQTVESYLNLVLMEKADKNTCLVSHSFQFFFGKP